MCTTTMNIKIWTLKNKPQPLIPTLSKLETVTTTIFNPQNLPLNPTYKISKKEIKETHTSGRKELCITLNNAL